MDGFNDYTLASEGRWFTLNEATMTCPTCTGMMQGLSGGHFWCGRCGTIRIAEAHDGQADAPKLVDRCRCFEEEVIGRECGKKAVADVWRRRGVQEAIRVPADRRAAT